MFTSSLHLAFIRSKSLKIEIWLRTIVYVFFFLAILIFFHPIIYLSKKFSPKRWRCLLSVMNSSLLLNIKYITGSQIKIDCKDSIFDKAIRVYVSNHQSMFDIPLIMETVSQGEKINFIAKRELGRWLPSISISLRSMGAALIDRSSLRQSLREIARAAKLTKIEYPALNSMCIFPEGTRARDGVTKEFNSAGLKKLLSELQADNDLPIELVPVAISGTWRLLRYNFLPVECFNLLQISFLSPIQITLGQKLNADQIKFIEQEISNEVERLTSTSNSNCDSSLFFSIFVSLIIVSLYLAI
jgi:1-acyl-sn-glycerol-3-phosphate acyltransferase